MQWNPPEGAPSKIISEQEFSHYDSGLDKENPDLKNDSDLSFYEPEPPNLLEDPNTQDSGYEGGKFYQFAQTLGVTPQSSWSGKRTFGSLESFDEEFMDLERLDENKELPTDFETLICGEIVTEPEVTPNSRNSRPVKRVKSDLIVEENLVSEESIKFAIQRSSAEPDLIGDFSKTYCLPLISGRHQDLKLIAPETLMNIIKGNYNYLFDLYKIIDCRFPYEFEGGHITGAINLYTKEQILDLLNEDLGAILIFHCEFSSERGPNLCRLLRNCDRIRNNSVYPKLNYPEMYVLEGGYKKFYEEFGDFCLPKGYTPMLHPDHQHELRCFRIKSKSCNESRILPSNRKLKRSGLF